MTQVTRQAAEATIKLLADGRKQYDSHCESCNYLSVWSVSPPCEYHAHIPAEVMLTDVLEKVGKPVDGKDMRWLHVDDLLHLWIHAGVVKSLQTILAEAEWEVTCDKCGMIEAAGIGRMYCGAEKEVLKSPEARALFDYLDQLFFLRTNTV